MNTQYNSEYDRISALKTQVENKEIKLEDLSGYEVAAIGLLCKVQNMIMRDEIEMNEALINGYKIRFANAIEYLKKKKNFEA